MINQKGAIPPTIILMILLPLFGFFLGIQYQKQVTNKTNPMSASNSEQELAEKEKEIQLLLKDSAEVGNPTKSTYKFEDIGIYSPLFSGKEVTSTVFTYKRKQITKKEITLAEDENKNSTAGITVWEYTSWNDTTDDPNMPYVTFGGYENYLVQPTIVEIDPRDLESFTNNKHIKMFWKYNYCPRQICAANLTFFSKYTPSGHPIYVEIWASNLSYIRNPNEIEQSSPGVVSAKQKVKEIVNTIEDFSTYH